MKYTKKELKDKRVEVKLSLDAKEWEEAVNAAYEKNKGKGSTSGCFRAYADRRHNILWQ